MSPSDIIKNVPEDFSLANALEAAEEMFRALPKTKQKDFVGHWNEIAVVIGRLRKWQIGWDEQAA